MNFFAAFITFVLVLFIAWCFGVEFEQGVPLGLSVSIAVFCALGVASMSKVK